jgi:hypothetical protein
MARTLDEFLTPKVGLNPTTITAGGGADNVAQNGATIAKAGYHQALGVVQYSSVIAASNTATVAAKFQTRTDGGAWSDVDGTSEVANLTDADTPGLVEIDCDLDGVGDEIRLVVTVNPSAANTDTVTVAGIVILGEADRNPV